MVYAESALGSASVLQSAHLALAPPFSTNGGAASHEFRFAHALELAALAVIAGVVPCVPDFTARDVHDPQLSVVPDVHVVEVPEPTAPTRLVLRPVMLAVASGVRRRLDVFYCALRHGVGTDTRLCEVDVVAIPVVAVEAALRVVGVIWAIVHGRVFILLAARIL